MKRLKLIVFAGLAAIALQVCFGDKLISAATNVGSAVTTNVNQDGLPINDAALVGRTYKVFQNSTTETVVCSGPCVLDGIYLTSGTASNYLIFRDTATADGSGTSILPAVYKPAEGANSTPLSGFVPIVTTIGLTVDSNAGTGFALIAYHMK
jgi:hypothetical protein